MAAGTAVFTAGLGDRVYLSALNDSADQLRRVIEEVAQGSDARRVAAVNRRTVTTSRWSTSIQPPLLDVAWNRSRYDAAGVLLENGADPTVLFNGLVTAVGLCAIGNVAASLSALLRAGHSANERFFPFWHGRDFVNTLCQSTPVHACLGEKDGVLRLECLKVLLAEGNADVNTTDWRGRNPLHLAASHADKPGFEEAFQLLLARSTVATRRALFDGDSVIDLIVSKVQNIQPLHINIILALAGTPVKPENAARLLPVAAARGNQLCAELAARRSPSRRWMAHDDVVQLAFEGRDAYAAEARLERTRVRVALLERVFKLRRKRRRRVAALARKRRERLAALEREMEERKAAIEREMNEEEDEVLAPVEGRLRELEGVLGLESGSSDDEDEDDEDDEKDEGSGEEEGK
jgi:hypothetical protein